MRRLQTDFSLDDSAGSSFLATTVSASSAARFAFLHREYFRFSILPSGPSERIWAPDAIAVPAETAL